MIEFKMTNMVVRALFIVTRWSVSWMLALLTGIAGLVVHRRLIDKTCARMRSTRRASDDFITMRRDVERQCEVVMAKMIGINEMSEWDRRLGDAVEAAGGLAQWTKP